jgi:hypothetical protein
MMPPASHRLAVRTEHLAAHRANPLDRLCSRRSAASIGAMCATSQWRCLASNTAGAVTAGSTAFCSRQRARLPCRTEPAARHVHSAEYAASHRVERAIDQDQFDIAAILITQRGERLHGHAQNPSRSSMINRQRLARPAQAKSNPTRASVGSSACARARERQCDEHVLRFGGRR